jgi:hypothetical protein
MSVRTTNRQSVSTARLQLVLYDPLDDSFLHPLRCYEDTASNRQYLRDLLEDFRRRTADQPDVLLCMGVVEVEAGA